MRMLKTQKTTQNIIEKYKRLLIYHVMCDQLYNNVEFKEDKYFVNEMET